MADDKAVLGRKIFFLNPPSYFKDDVIARLRILEYEVYAVDDYRVAKNIATLWPDSILFITPSDVLTHNGWRAYVKSMKDSEQFAALDVGFIMQKMSEERMKTFIAGTPVSAGVYSLGDDPEELAQKILQEVDRLGAKGMRKYIRADCLNEKDADIYWLSGSKMVKLKMIDISAVGIAATMSTGLQNEVFVNQLIPSAYVNMDLAQTEVSLKVTAIKAAGDNMLVILMYGMDTHPNAIAKIRAYVDKILQRKLVAAISAMPLESTNYNAIKA